MTHGRRAITILVSAALTASLAITTLAAPVAAAKPKCMGQKATIVGTNKADVLRGTPKRDVIVAKGGADKIFGRAGNDIICAGPGNDRVAGQAGHDRIAGQTGADRLFGGGGVDRLMGNAGHDFLAGQAGPDVLAGGVGDDKLDGGIGVDLCAQGSGVGRHSRCERPTAPRIFARAYSDLVRDHKYGAGDVMIAQLEDTNLDGIPSAGDTIRMGKYPTSATPTSLHYFLDWPVRSHTVTEAGAYYKTEGQVAARVLVKTAPDAIFDWVEYAWSHDFSERTGGLVSAFVDALKEGQLDLVLLEPASPSQPKDYDPPHVTDPSDNLFIEIDIFP